MHFATKIIYKIDGTMKGRYYNMLTEKEFEYAALASQITKRKFNDMCFDMALAKEKYSIPFELFFNKKLFNYSEKTWRTQSEIYSDAKEKEALHYKMIMDDTKMSKEMIDQHIAIINKNPYSTISINEYAERKMYYMDEYELKEFLINIGKRRRLAWQIKKEFEYIDSNNGTYENVNLLINEYYAATKATLLFSEIEEFKPTIEKCDKEILNNKLTTVDTVTDMLLCKRLMGFWDFEYFMFGLRNKTIKERREYISNIDRTVRVSKVNDRIESSVLDDKYKTYLLLGKYYKRDLINVTTEDDFLMFEKFIENNKSFVKKLGTGAMGEGVSKIDYDGADLHTFFKELLVDGSFVAEALICQHNEMKRLNPDSVNTVRMTTYFDGNKVHILWPWVKVGRAGSFVDNSGAGGMGVAIDINTGYLISDAMDENGNQYSIHPDNGLVFKEYKVPAWEKAVKFATEIMNELVNKTDKVNYVGWDITYTEDNQWAIVEGNAFPQFVQQATYGKGFKKEFDKILR